MTYQQQDLKKFIEAQKSLINEINEMTSSIAAKKELAFKYQGIIEYLNSLGVSLPEELEEQTVELEEQTVQVESKEE